MAYTPWEGEQETSLSRHGKLTISKLKSSRLAYILDETIPFVMDKCKSKKGASVSKEFTVYNLSPVGYI